MSEVRRLARPAKKAAKKTAKKADPQPAPPPPDPEPAHEASTHPEISAEDLAAATEVLDGEILDPAYEAYILRRNCVPWREVARRCGFRTDNDAWVAVHQLLQRAAGELAPARRAAALEMSIDRHEAIVGAFWDAATLERDPHAAAIISRELAALDRVQRLGEKDTDAGVGGRTIVVAGTPEEYVLKLQQIAAGERKVPELEGRIEQSRIVDVAPV